uniref:Uncharacterized protein n=1 Tax=Chromera velia CCMP2878 TaxID=1169474 RepID=A0A0G4HDM5_9ALVE|mmetsp:Transcript_42664/g.84159  ORF Transcript_42664/g.84159 Transcript_42664/m.84159 type:complete len:115 (+) Transcript_42664:182-526(+)|eukprot:Cvel_6452.t1-p1 / transcript=Cvel_6452.t1 / gene=Cvel_6452 / organism=Chromera_velia_CCMP2878 / gene_product=hypothetical protein / transcript_product=hypothetical protein / location=Cvel_scaffold316:6729-8536(+) / protein_length=114 / sequence_SO=supercontig / SO=protein_coding / is_pseudo=false
MADVADNQFVRGKPSTRLFAPPGGNTSISFGDEQPAAATAKPTFKGKEGETGGAPTEEVQQQRPNPAPVQEKPAEVAGKPAGSMPSSETTTAQAEKSSVRVRQPPGGGSSIVFG